jgi:hypothetical protein
VIKVMVDLRRRRIVLERDGVNLRWRAPAGVVSSADLETLRSQKAGLLHRLADLESLEADGTAKLWRQVYEDLPERDRERLAEEVAGGDPIGCLLALCLDVLVTSTKPESARGAA